ncbi:MAG: DUF5333 family protein, partial [Pseudomonadota bacterium]
RPAPAYLSDMFAQVYAAETLAHWCPTVSVDADGVEKAWLKVFARLDEDGFDGTPGAAGMADPSDAIGAAVADWAEKRRLTNASEVSQVCRAADKEIAERTLIGSFLRRTAG